MQNAAKTLSTHAHDDMPGHIRTDDGAALFYREWGAGRPMLFMAGWSMNSAMWDYQMLPLSEQGFRCIAYDRRAHGRSSDPGAGFDYDTLADDLAAVIDTLDLTDVILVGHSFASGEIVRYLTRHGDRRVSKVVLIAPAAIPCPLARDDNPLGFPAAAIEGLLETLADDFPTWAEDNSGPFFTVGGRQFRTLLHAGNLARGGRLDAADLPSGDPAGQAGDHQATGFHRLQAGTA